MERAMSQRSLVRIEDLSGTEGKLQLEELVEDSNNEDLSTLSLSGIDNSSKEAQGNNFFFLIFFFFVHLFLKD
jgi:hypothetical protein